ncbi:major facilitator superfamily protein [Stylonychia lemnae]|uniref:Major facilitator superfamily protein n=1 Tax=Stylonychia lemnae TaxID=5949 RepID=A0A078B7Z6_STYLE|nr:major facilitator superfamily protein [Stylonychia lemnae]|eukprot:CDW90524.1 major facilitator superfamily protein [Stylonychia lemnae]
MKFSQEKQESQYDNFGKAIYCSVGFLILYTALNPIQNLYTQIMFRYNNGSFGFYYRIKWVAGYKYISECASEETKGLYFSFFWGIYIISQILGSLLAAFVSENFKQTTLLIIMAALTSLSLVIFSTLADPIPQVRYLPIDDNDQSQEDPQNRESSKIHKKYKNYSAIPDNPVLQNDNNHNSNLVFAKFQNRRNTTISLNQEVKETLLLIKSRKLLPLLPQLLWLGISEAIYVGILVNIIIDTQSTGNDNHKIYISMLSMVFFGIGNIVGSLFIGWTIDKYGNKKSAWCIILFLSIQTIVMLGYLIDYEYSWLTYALTFVWGLQDGSNNTLSNEILGFEFKNNSQCFAISNLCVAISASLFNCIQGFVDGQEQYIIYTSAIGFIGILSNISTLYFKFKPLPQQLRQSMKQEDFQ